MPRSSDPGGWLPYSLSEWYYDRTQGSKSGNRMDIIFVDHNEKSKKARRSFLSFLSGRKVERVARDPVMRQVLGDVNRDVIQRDQWRRDQGGASVYHEGGGWGYNLPDVDPGPGAGFLQTPQVFGAPPGGYYDENGMWRDA